MVLGRGQEAEHAGISKAVQLGGVAVTQRSGGLPSVRASKRTFDSGAGRLSMLSVMKIGFWVCGGFMTFDTSTVFVLTMTCQKPGPLTFLLINGCEPKTIRSHRK